MTTRRNLLIALGASALTVPLCAFAQQQDKVWRVGVLAVRGRSTTSRPEAEYDAFLHGMRDLGYMAGRNLLIEWRSAEGKYERFTELAAELVRTKVDIIVTEGTPATRAAQLATRTIPIVTAVVADPVASGFAASLAHPGGNITGLSSISIDISSKQIELLKSMAPKLSRAAIVTNPDASHHPAIVQNLQAAARQIGIKVLPVSARNAESLRSVFTLMARERADGVLIASDAFFSGQLQQIADLANAHRLPSIYTLPGFAQAGGLMSYGQNLVEHFRRAATYVDKILKGAKPADLPVEQPTKFELIINGKTAKALGLKIPQSLLISADKVIE